MAMALFKAIKINSYFLCERDENVSIHLDRVGALALCMHHNRFNEIWMGAVTFDFLLFLFIFFYRISQPLGHYENCDVYRVSISMY